MAKINYGLFFMSLSILILGSIISCSEVENDFSKAGPHHIRAKKGSIFEFSLPQNKSTGYELCWLNEPKLASKFEVQSIRSKLKDANNIDGGGEMITYQMLANKGGTDTLKFKNCPTRLWQKECSFFTVDSIRKKERGAIVSIYAPDQDADIEIVITVEE